MAKREKSKKFSGERGALVCAKHSVPVVLRPRGYGFYCPRCQAEKDPNMEAKTV
jgi:hypothetical protein